MPDYRVGFIDCRLYRLIDDWCEQHQYGRVCPGWGVVLQRRAENWVPVPDLTSVSYKRLPAVWQEDKPCPVVPELMIEIISLLTNFWRAGREGNRLPFSRCGLRVGSGY